MKFFKKSDLITIAVLFIICLATAIIYQTLFANKSTNAEIYYGSLLVKTVPLKSGKEETFTLKQNENVVFEVTKDGSIRFLESDCPDKVCVRSGKLGMVGESAACLPNKMIIKLVPADGKWGTNADIVV